MSGVEDLDITDEMAVRRFIEAAEAKEDVVVGMRLARIVDDYGQHVRALSQLREENRSLKKKMGYLERRAMRRHHGLVDLFCKHDDE